MQIGVDGNEANVEKRVGVSVYTLELLRYFHDRSSAQTSFIIYLREDPRDDLPKRSDIFRYEVVKSPGFWRDIFLPMKLYTSKRPDVFFSPAHYTPRFSPIPVVVTIHDVAYEYYPQEFLQKDLYKLKNWTAHAVNQAQKIIAVSQNTKKDIVKFYKTSADKIEVVYNGFKVSQNPNASSFKLQASNYLLYTGTIQPRKNLITLIRAFDKVSKNYPDLQLVIAGKKGWLYNTVFEEVKKRGLEKKVIFTGFVSDQELAALYKNAQAFILPSLYEGFGLPVLEAMYYGCPVITSNISSLPEVGGEACLYFNPQSTVELESQIEKILENPALRQDLIKKGHAQVEKFSWDKCADATLTILKAVAANQYVSR